MPGDLKLLAQFTDAELSAELYDREKRQKRFTLERNIEFLRKLKPHAEIFPHRDRDENCITFERGKINRVRCVLDELDNPYAGKDSEFGFFKDDLEIIAKHVFKLSLE